MATDALKKFAEELKVFRIAKEISVQQIASKTRIDPKFIYAIENADFDTMPDIYMRAFIKEYCQILDLNSKEILKRYDEAKNWKSGQNIANNASPLVEEVKDISKSVIKTPTEQEETQTVSNEVSVRTAVKSKSPTPINVIIGGIVLVLAMVVFYFAFINNSSTDIVKENPEKEITNNTSQRFETEPINNNQPLTQQDVPVIQNQPDSLHLRLTTSARVWVKVSSDGKIIQQGYVEQDAKLNFSSKKNFSVSIGNAGVVKLFFNDKPIENIGKAGEIRNIFISPEATRYYTIKPKSDNEKSAKKD
jgi:cytoskeleton protein RodZ